MDIKEIQQRSEQIALMLGYVNTTPDDRDFNIYENKLKPFSVIPKMIETMSMLFYSDWNWLMEAVEFIDKYDFNSGTEHISCTNVLMLPIYSNIQTVFIAISDFAKVYNEKLAD